MRQDFRILAWHLGILVATCDVITAYQMIRSDIQDRSDCTLRYNCSVHIRERSDIPSGLGLLQESSPVKPGGERMKEERKIKGQKGQNSPCLNPSHHRTPLSFRN